MSLSATKVLTWLASPLGFFVWGLALAGLATLASFPCARRIRHAAAALAAIAAIQLAAFAWNPVADLVMGPLEEAARAAAAEAPRQGYAAILVLGGGTKPPPRNLFEPPNFNDGTTRVWYAAQLYRAEVAPLIIVSGGNISKLSGTALPPEAEAMRDVLIGLGVPRQAILLDSSSLTTRENARASRRLVGDHAMVALVTSAFHMKRALWEVQAAELRPHAFPVDFSPPYEQRLLFEQWLPGPGTLESSTTAIKEWLGLLAIWLGIDR